MVALPFFAERSKRRVFISPLLAAVYAPTLRLEQQPYYRVVLLRHHKALSGIIIAFSTSKGSGIIDAAHTVQSSGCAQDLGSLFLIFCHQSEYHTNRSADVAVLTQLWPRWDC